MYHNGYLLSQLIIIIIIIDLYSLKTWHEYYKQSYPKNIHTMSLYKKLLKRTDNYTIKT